MNQSRPLTRTEVYLVSQALRREADRIMRDGLNPELMAAVVATEGLPEEAKQHLANRAVKVTKRVDALEVLADVIERHGATISGPIIIPEQG